MEEYTHFKNAFTTGILPFEKFIGPVLCRKVWAYKQCRYAAIRVFASS